MVLHYLALWRLELARKTCAIELTRLRRARDAADAGLAPSPPAAPAAPSPVLQPTTT
jgi:hypothetical protein